MTSAIQAVSAAVVPATAATSQTAMRNRPHEALCVPLRLESSLAGVLSLLRDITDSAPYPTLGHVDSLLIAATRQLAGAKARCHCAPHNAACTVYDFTDGKPLRALCERHKAVSNTRRHIGQRAHAISASVSGASTRNSTLSENSSARPSSPSIAIISSLELKSSSYAMSAFAPRNCACNS